MTAEEIETLLGIPPMTLTVITRDGVVTTVPELSDAEKKTLSDALGEPV